MKKIFYKAIMAAASLFAFAALFGQTDQERLEAEKNSKSRELSLKERESALMPQTEFSAAAKEFAFGAWSQKAGHAFEKIYAVPKSALRPDFSTSDAARLMASISKMQGMLYYSRSDKDWGVLYSKAFRIESPESDAPVPDDAGGSMDGKTIYAFMDDHTFGKSKYKITYMQGDGALAIFMENVSPLCYGPIKAVQPGGFKMCAVVVDSGSEYLVYMCDYAEFKIMNALKKRLNNSFEARLEAICLWFMKEAR